MICAPYPARELYRRAPVDDKELVWRTGAWHDLLHEPDYAEVLEITADFIKRHLDG